VVGLFWSVCVLVFEVVGWKYLQDSEMAKALNLLSTMILLTCVHAIYFNLEDGQNRCFLEEVPKDTLILGRFKADISALPAGGPAVPGFQFAGRPFGGIAQQMQQQAPPGVGIKVTVTDPSGNLALQRELPSEGRFALTSQMGGEFKICVQTNTSARWFGSKQKLVQCCIV
jgi:hypothetical protein